MSVDIDEHGQYENIRVFIRVRPESLVERKEGECLTDILPPSLIVFDDVERLIFSQVAAKFRSIFVTRCTK